MKESIAFAEETNPEASELYEDVYATAGRIRSRLIKRRVEIDILRQWQKLFTPKLSDTMTEGIVSWLKQVGDEVESGEIFAEIETDKAAWNLSRSSTACSCTSSGTR